MTYIVRRTAHRFAHYSGDATSSLGQVMGPNTLGERMTVVSAQYFDDEDKTRLGFDFYRNGDDFIAAEQYAREE